MLHKYPLFEVVLCLWIHAYILCFYGRINRKLSLNIQSHVKYAVTSNNCGLTFPPWQNNNEGQNTFHLNCLRNSSVRTVEISPLSMANSFSKAATSVLRPRTVQAVGRGRALHALTLLGTGLSFLKFLTHRNQKIWSGVYPREGRQPSVLKTGDHGTEKEEHCFPIR